MDVLVYNQRDHFETIKDWYKKRGMPEIKPSFLAENGMIVSDEDLVCAGFFGTVNSECGYFENIISNPDSDKKTRSEGLDILFESLVSLAKISGCKHITFVSNHDKLINRIERHGFRKLESGLTLLGRGL